jgi:membrane protease YdiL (CAAX protease family)
MSTAAVSLDAVHVARDRWTRPLATFALAWAIATIGVYAFAPAAAITAVASMAVLGVLMPVLVVWLTRGIETSPAPIAKPTRAAWLAVGYVVALSVLVFGVAFGAIHAALTDDRARAAALLALKLVTMVLLPWLIARAAGWPAIAHARKRRLRVALVVAAGAIVIVALATPSLAEIAALKLSWPALVVALLLAAMWAIVNAALPEEILFRYFLQTGLAAGLRSQTWAVSIGALLFALVHVPGLYLRADQANLMGDPTPSLLACICYAVAVLAPPGVLFGLLWLRLRSLTVLVLVHAAIDWLPNVAPAWRLWA